MRNRFRAVGLAQFVRKRLSRIMLVLLLLGIVEVYGRIIFTALHTPAASIPPAVSEMLTTRHAVPLTFPRLHAVNSVVWGKMSAAQRRALSQQRRLRYEVFFLAFAHATPEQQRTVVERTRLRFEMDFLRFAHAGMKQRQVVVQQIKALFPSQFRNERDYLQRTMAMGLASGNPEMHAAMAQFFMAIRNSR